MLNFQGWESLQLQTALVIGQGVESSADRQIICTCLLEALKWGSILVTTLAS